MKLLIMQPNLEKTISQLETELRNNPSVDAVIFPEGYLNENVEQARELARGTQTILIGGYRRMNESPKDRSILIDRDGEVRIDRVKYSPASFARVEGVSIGHILCDELIVQGLKLDGSHEDAIDLIVHPIGVGMFSEEQFDEWIREARRIAIEHRVAIIGTSHADGSYRGSGISIPIAYSIESSGETGFISHGDTRTRVIEFSIQRGTDNVD